MRTLQTQRCTLEPQLEAHAAEMFAVLADPAIYEFENEPPSSAQWLAQRYRRLESRGPEDGSEQWLNWVVQATVLPTAVAFVAYALPQVGQKLVRLLLRGARLAD
jgi:hypothetical protein